MTTLQQFINNQEKITMAGVDALLDSFQQLLQSQQDDDSINKLASHLRQLDGLKKAVKLS